MCEDCKRQNEKHDAARESENRERAILQLPNATTTLMGRLSALQQKVSGGVKLVETDREHLNDAWREFNLQLEGLLGEEPPRGIDRDNDKAQQFVDEFVKELIEDDETASGVVKALRSADPYYSSERKVVWRESHSQYLMRHVTVQIPDVILDDGELFSRLEEKFNSDFEYELTQDYKIDHEDSNEDSEMTIED